MRIGWKQQYEIGIPSIDEQHKKLLSLINTIGEKRDTAPQQKEIFALLNQLVQYAEKHFDTEERFMKAVRYPKFLAHQRLHESFLTNIITFAEQLEKRQPKVFEQILQFLKEWYINHIGGADKEYKEYFLSHKSQLLSNFEQKE